MEGNSGLDIIYDDEEIRVVWRQGQSDFVLVTFAELGFVASSLRYFADGPVSKLDLSCVGIIAKSNSWYPQKNMVGAIERIWEKISLFESIVLYGGSMGGYAALKYSAALKATQVISFCPQWSIDKAECAGFDPGFQEYFVETMRNMGVERRDLGGDVFLFYDYYYSRDRFHCQNIAERYEKTHLINVPRVGHHVTPVLAGTHNISLLISACRNGDLGLIKKITRSRRQTFEHRVDSIRRFARSRGFSCRHGLERDELSDYAALLDKYPSHFFRLMVQLNKAERFDDMAQLGAMARKYFSTIQAEQISFAFCANLLRRPIVIRTFHGTALVFDVEAGKCIHTVKKSETLFPVFASIDGRNCELYIQVAQAKFNISVAQNGEMRSSELQNDNHRFDLRLEANGRFSISNSGKFLCAEPEMEMVLLNRAVASKWELFYFDVDWTASATMALAG